MAWIPEEWVCICTKLWKFSIKWHFWTWTRPFFKMTSKTWVLPFRFCNLHIVGPWQGSLGLLNGPKQLYLAFLRRLGYEFSQKMGFGPFSQNWQMNWFLLWAHSAHCAHMAKYWNKFNISGTKIHWYMNDHSLESCL